MAVQIAVCGPQLCTAAERATSYRVGQLLADHDVVLLCGGGGGAMAAASAGAREHGGLVVGIRPDGDRRTADEQLTVTVLTDLGQARNAVIVASADAVIVTGDSWGTFSELALAMRRGVPVISTGRWQVTTADGPVPGVQQVSSAEQAVAAALAALGSQQRPSDG